MISIYSDSIKLHGAGNSERGGRPENQDNWISLDTPLGFLVIVCDGMGGGPGGKTASELAIQAVANCFRLSNTQASPEEVMKRAVAKAEETLEEKMQQAPFLAGMGSTLVALLINKDKAWIAHLGDSRCYQMRGKKMIFRTKDHSLVGELVQYKSLTEEQARTSPQSNVITRALGSTQNHVAEIETVSYRKGDRFILCSDGVWGIMPQEQLLNRFTSTPRVDAMVSNLSKEIDNIGFGSDGHHDNHTLAVVDMGENSNFQGNMTKSAKIIIAILSGLLFISLLVNIIGIKNVETYTLVQDDASIKEAADQDILFLNSQIEAQFEQNKELEEKNKELAEENEKLKKQLESARESENKPSDRVKDDNTVEEPKDTTAQKTQLTLKKEAKSTAEKIVERLDEMINFKFDVSKLNSSSSTRTKTARAAKAKIRNAAKELIADLNKQTSGSYFNVLDDIRRQLADPASGETPCMLVAPDKDGKNYISPEGAKNALNKMKESITNEIINQL